MKKACKIALVTLILLFHAADSKAFQQVQSENGQRAKQVRLVGDAGASNPTVQVREKDLFPEGMAINPSSAESLLTVSTDLNRKGQKGVEYFGAIKG